MKQSLSRKITSIIVLTVLIAVGLVSFFSSYNIHNRFKEYIIEKQNQTINQIIAQVSLQYDIDTHSWNQDKVHEVGMIALSSGYIIKVYDNDSVSVWDAEAWDMSACVQLINDVTHRMLSSFPSQEGAFASTDYLLEYQNENVGKLTISHYGPFFYQEDDLVFINQLQLILLIIAMVSILSSVLVGLHFAKTYTKPLLITIDATKNIASGHYESKIEDTSNILEVSELIDSVNHLSKSLSQQDHIKRQISADVAHELRTPLSTLQIMVEAMLDGIISSDQKRIKSIHDEIIRLTNIVKDLEQLNQVEIFAKELDYQTFDIKELILECVSSLEIMQNEKHIVTHVNSDSIIIEADKARLNQVMYNLIVNAYKYSDEHSQLTINVQSNDAYITLIIMDTGIGIPEDSIPYLFERFYRVDSSRSRESGGSGIGLTIVKQFVEAHHGNIEVESEVGVGSTFTIVLPKRKQVK